MNNSDLVFKSKNTRLSYSTFTIHSAFLPQCPLLHGLKYAPSFYITAFNLIQFLIKNLYIPVYKFQSDHSLTLCLP